MARQLKTSTLLCSTQRSNGKQLTHGSRIVSERVRDATADESTDFTNANQYTTIVVCSFEKVTDFTAVKDSTFIAVISKVAAPSKQQHNAADLYIEAMEAVPNADVDAAVAMLRQLQRVANMHRGDASTSSEAAWQQRKCRRMLRYPTMT